MKRFLISLFALLLTSLVLAQPTQIPDSSLYTVIRGAFVIEGYEPDGDSLRFIADNLKDWDSLENAKSIYEGFLDTDSNNKQSNPDKKNSVQLRFEGLDTPEFGDGIERQPLGKEARDFSLQFLGYQQIEFTAQGKQVRRASPNRTRGVLLSRSAPSGTRGRPVVYVFREADWVFSQAKQTMIKPVWLEKSLNYALMKKGLAFPEYYLSLPVSHREVFKEAVTQARKEKLGVHLVDQSTNFTAEEFVQIAEQGELIFPKLYRRLKSYFAAREDKKTSLSFHEFLRQGKVENDQLIYQGKRFRLTDFLVQKGNEFWFKADLNEIVFEQ
jgi:endonuclease YncB( thermonuclease family)